VRAFLTAIAPLVLRTVRRVLGRGHADTEDLVQEALLGTLEALPRFRGECSTTHFVRRVSLLTALNARRRHERRHQIAPMVDDAETDALPSPEISPVQQVEADRLREIFLTLLDELAPVQAEALALHCVLGFTVAETAAACGAPINTVRGRIVTAKAALRERLASDPSVRELFRGAS
jgi:RNA polymerase sigma-70 factor (ECF subfamily)